MLHELHGQRCADLGRLDADPIGAKNELRAVQCELDGTKAELDESKIELSDDVSNLRMLTHVTECKNIKQCVRLEGEQLEGDETPLQPESRELLSRSLTKTTRQESSLERRERHDRV